MILLLQSSHTDHVDQWIRSVQCELSSLTLKGRESAAGRQLGGDRFNCFDLVHSNSPDSFVCIVSGCSYELHFAIDINMPETILWHVRAIKSTYPMLNLGEVRSAVIFTHSISLLGVSWFSEKLSPLLSERRDFNPTISIAGWTEWFQRSFNFVY